jgi:hypothetical protein
VSNRIASLVSQVLRSSPLRHASFRTFYIGSVGAALGYTTQTTIVAWLMATLTPSALMVALVQSASTAPSLLLGLFAGVLADLVDRRRVILITQIALFVATAILGSITLFGVITPAILTHVHLIGACFTPATAQSASINDLAASRAARRGAGRGCIQRRARHPALAGRSSPRAQGARSSRRILLSRDDLQLRGKDAASVARCRAAPVRHRRPGPRVTRRRCAR